MDYSLPIDVPHPMWRGFVDEHPCVMPSIVNHHQRLSMSTDFHNFRNSCEAIRTLDYFSGQQNVIYNQWPNLPPFVPYPMATLASQSDYLQTPICCTHPPNYLQSSPSVPEPVKRLKGSRVRQPGSNRAALEKRVNTDSIVHECPSSNKRMKHSSANELSKAPPPVNSVIDSNKHELPAPECDATSNKENNDPNDPDEVVLTPLEIHQLYYKHFKKKRAMVEKKLNDLAKLKEALLMENIIYDENDDSINYYRHKKMKRFIKYSTVVEAIPVSKPQDEVPKEDEVPKQEKPQRVPFKEQFSNAN